MNLFRVDSAEKEILNDLLHYSEVFVNNDNVASRSKAEQIHFVDYSTTKLNWKIDLYSVDDEQHGRASTMTGITGVDDNALKSYQCLPTNE